MRKITVWLPLLTALSISVAWPQDYSLEQFLNIQRALSPGFNPGGTEIVYLTNISGVNQAWKTTTWPGPSRQLTFGPDGIDGAWWCPTNADLMVLAASRGGSERSQLYLFNPNGSPWYRVTADDEAVYAFGAWSRDGTRFAFASNERNKIDFDIYEHSVSQTHPRLLFEAEGHNRVAGYSPDGKYLLVTRTHSSVNGDVFLYDFESGEARLLTQHEGNAVFDSPQWDGTSDGFYLLSDRDREFLGLAHWNISDGTMDWTETPDWDVDNLAVAPDGTTMTWTVNESGYSKFHFRDLKQERDVGPYRFPDGIIMSVTYSPNGKQVAAVFGTATRPFDIWVYETDSEKLHQVTYSATGGVPPALFASPELIEYETFDQRLIPAYWYVPAEHEGRMPVIVHLHGGPESQARPDMSGLIQYFLYRGYAVLEPNVRGSSGFGRSYLQLDDREQRMDAVQDVEYAAKWLAKRKDVDKDQLVVYGGSYGGFLVLSSLAASPDLWAAGVSVVGISNFVTFLENTSPYRRVLREAEYGSLDTDRDLLTAISPLTHVDKIKTPLMLIQGANDPRVPQSESDQIAEAIRAKGGIVEYLLFEDEGHGLRKTENRIEAYSKVVDFLDNHVLNR